MNPDDIGRVALGTFDNISFGFSARPEFWLGKALELDLAARTLYVESKNLLEKRERIAAEASLNFFRLPAKVEPFPSDPRMYAGTWQTMMMCGFALENVFKALLIRSHPEKVESGTLQGFNHDLVRLADLCGVPLSDVETRLCEICTHATVVAGRYPTSLKARDLVAEWVVNLGPAWETYETLFKRSLEQAKN